MMLIYQAGVAARLVAHDGLRARLSRGVLGTSGGACVGAMFALGLARGDDGSAAERLLEAALEYYCAGRLFEGAGLGDYLDPSKRLLPRMVDELGLLDADAPAALHAARFAAHATPRRLPLENVALGAFASADDVVRAVQASCCLDPRGVDVGGVRHLDGALSDSLPLCADAGVETITVAPFTGPGVDIAPGLAARAAAAAPARAWPPPREPGAPRLGRWLRYDVTPANAPALVDTVVPRARRAAEARFEQGRRDGAAFLRVLGYSEVID